MPRIIVISAALAASLAFAGLGAVAPATASETLGTGSKPAAAEHCAVEVRAVGERAAPSAPVCFSEPEGVERYLDAIGTADASGRAVAASSTALGTVYANSNGGGSSLTFWGSSGCYGVLFGFSSMPSGWSSNVSSAGGSNGCWVTVYGTTGYGGSRLNCTPWCGGVGGLNDQVKSIVFRPTGTFG
ncbi:hypothetical protein ASD23_12535 [Agromyces sp. Root1464]|uniref:hypothetical protein n=1 Tax=Agromyces sp. Root1464 TaxID=1736467 RepID=UPI0006F73BC3|nr:hypothetical protein [Agromyces sp. Root1464]KQZ09120.1 hypothetical protein ASD23_12535 [Agromyces sp. Root1464]